MSETTRESQARAQSDGHGLAAAIQTRRLRKCIAEGVHVDAGCGRCGL